LRYDVNTNDYVAGTFVIYGADGSYIRVTDSEVAEKADVTVDYDGTGPLPEVTYQWDWIGDVFP
jgi:hypothetical protein